MSQKIRNLAGLSKLKIFYDQALLFQLKRISFFIIRFSLSIPLLPAAFAIKLSKYKYVNIYVDRIGHLAIEPDALIKAQKMGLIDYFIPIMLAPESRISNIHLIKYWKQYFIIIQNPFACFVFRSICFWGIGEFNINNYMRNIGSTQECFSISSKWGDRSPLLKITDEDEQWLKSMLNQLGVPEEQWFVCIHNRESGYSPIDEYVQNHRNSSIENMRGAIDEIILRGGWVIRLGDPSMNSLDPIPPQYIEYTKSPLRSARLDVLLCAKSKFILGNTSGIALVGSVFGTPCALCNMTPISALGINKRDISIPKLYYSNQLKRILTVSELVKYGLESCQFATIYDSLNIVLIENSNSQIRDLAVEMFENLNTIGIKADPLQNQFINLLSINAYSFQTPAKPAITFLKKNIYFLK